MGNEIQCGPCTDLNPDMYLRGFGDIKYIPSENKDNKVLSFYDIISDRDEESLKRKQSALMDLMVNLDTFIIKPQRIEPISAKGLWMLKEYSFKVYYDNYVYNLASYSRDNIKSNTFVPEVQIIRCVSCVTHALATLKRKKIRHMNVSPDTIFIDPFGNWILCPPKHDSINLLTRSSANKKLAKSADNYDYVEYLIAPEMAESGAELDFWKSDLFSLGICVVHAVFPFKLDDLMQKPSQECIRKKLDYIESYYSKKLFEILSGVLKLDAQERMTVEQLCRTLADLQDCKGI